MRFRRGENIDLDYSASAQYGVDSSNKFGREQISIDYEMAKMITQVALSCPLCNSLIHSEIVGLHLAKRLQGRCPNSQCRNHNLSMQYKINHFWPINLSTVFLTLSNDSGYRGCQAIAWSHNFEGMSKESYQRHCRFIFDLMDLFYVTNQKKAVESVKKYYVRTGEGEIKDGILDITITLDGAYSRRGTESTICFSAAIDPWTNRIIDFQATQKCFECADCDKQDTECLLEDPLFHGPTGNMEAYNAIILFKRSLSLGLRYIYFTFLFDNHT